MPEIDDAVILNVRTFRRTDSEPSIEMDVPELNAFDDEDQPDDTSFDGYAAAEFDEATRVEMHADWYNDETEAWERVIDGEEATWDSTNAVVSFDLARAHTPEVGQYRFEWVLVEDGPDADGNVPTSATADHVNTIPIENYYGYRVTSATARDLAAREPINRTVGRLTVEDYLRGPNGPVSLAASPPEDPYHATHKQYVDGKRQESADALTSHEQTGLHDQTQFGENLAETITETTSPASFSFTAGDNRDILDVADVTLSNGTAASVTEDVTVDLHDGTDATAPVIATETKSVTVAAGTAVTESFIAADTPLGAGDYHIEISQSGVDLSIDETTVQTLGSEYVTTETDTGDLVTTDHRGRERRRYDAIDNRVEYEAVEANEVLAKRNPIINVKAFGAVGDGQTDDTAAIQAAFDAIPDELATEAFPAQRARGGGGIVHFPQGRYLISDTIDGRDKNVLVQGPKGSGIALIQLEDNATVSGDAMLELGRTDSDDAMFCSVEHINLIMDEAAQTGTIENLRLWNNIRHCHINDVELTGATGSNLRHATTTNGQKLQNMFINDSAFELAMGHAVNLQSLSYDLVIQGSYFGFEAGAIGIQLWTGANATRISNCWFLPGTGSCNRALYHTGSELTLVGCQFETADVNQAAIHLNGVNDAIISNNTVGLARETAYSNDYAYRFQDCGTVKVSGDIVNGYGIAPLDEPAANGVVVFDNVTDATTGGGLYNRDGSETQSGDGTATSFSWPHGLPEAPNYVSVEAASAAAAGYDFVTADATNITVEYSTAPASGTDNLTWFWEARAR